MLKSGDSKKAKKLDPYGEPFRRSGGFMERSYHDQGFRCCKITISRIMSANKAIVNMISAAKLPNLYCDCSRLRVMLLNMLSSAAKFDKPRRMVEIGTDCRMAS